jgi:hypothetical protein
MVQLTKTDMHFNKRSLGAACVLLVVAVGAVTWLHAAIPSIGAVAANPSYVVINTPTPVIITAQISDPALIANGVTLLKVDSAGKTLATIGVMRDDGANGDAVAGDKTFSYKASVNEPAVKQVYYRVSAAFKGVLQRSLSSVVVLSIDPFKLPPDPAEAGTQTLAGIDSDHDGVRDDIQRYIAFQYYASPEKLNALSEYATALQSTYSATSTNQQIVNAQSAAVRCIAYRFRGTDWSQVSADLRSRELDTPGRLRAYATLRESTSDSLPPIRLSELSGYCGH